MRRLAILLILLGAMQYILPLRAEVAGTRALMTFGFLILAAVTVGELAKAVRLPKIVGYLGAGLIFGPHVTGVFDSQAAADLSGISTLAIALIAFLAGAELRWSEVRSRWRVILAMLGSELLLSLLAITVTLFALQSFVPALSGSTGEVLVLCLLIGSILVVHSPAVTMAMLGETGASGEVARTTLGIVLVADVVVVLLFSGTLSLTRAVLDAGAAGGPTFGSIAWEIFGAVILGAVLGGLVSLYLRWQTGELFIFAIAVALFGGELAKVAHVETLLMLLTAGFVMENVSSGRGEMLRHAMERSAAPVFVVFFALAGAKIQPAEVAALAVVAVPVVLARMLGIWGGARLGARLAVAAPGVRDHAWKGLISQAGVAIGLATLMAETLPAIGPALQGLVLAVIAINETMGPIFFRRGLVAAGEMPPEGRPSVELQGPVAGAATP